ncbi:MAG: MBL fold metallo-hydrolase [Myxococcales bacterium]|nr:MBL fold metallo-hydrolase [Myxococcales bacterium]
MRLEFHGAIQTVTGSAYVLQIGAERFLFDCGMYQGASWLEKRNFLPFYFDPRQIKDVIVTHAHIDHIGLLPKLVREGFAGKIHATSATVDLARILLLDAAHIAEADTERRNRKFGRAGRPQEQPLYTAADAEKALEHLVAHRYHEEVPIGDGLRVVFRDAGHILGSAFIQATATENGNTRRILFSGDIGNRDQAIIKDPEAPEPADVLLIESTYGDRLHKPRPDTMKELHDILAQAYRDGGNVVIPAFAVGRTQEILYRLRELADEGRLPAFRVFVDSPLAISATRIVQDNPDCYDDETIYEISASGRDPLAVPNLRFTRQTIESQEINNVKEPCLIISASGMCNAGRILHHLKHNLWRRENHIVFVGYQGEGTLGRLLVDGAPRVKIMGEEVAVAAHIHTIGGFSAHADRDGLLEWMQPLAAGKPRTFIVHGEEKSAAAFAGEVNRRYGIRPVLPLWHEKVLL